MALDGPRTKCYYTGHLRRIRQRDQASDWVLVYLTGHTLEGDAESVASVDQLALFPDSPSHGTGSKLEAALLLSHANQGSSRAHWTHHPVRAIRFRQVVVKQQIFCRLLNFRRSDRAVQNELQWEPAR